MGKKLLQPQEIEVFYVLPALKRYLSIYMKEKDINQTEIAKLLDLEKAAVSQYINNKRGNKIDFNEDLKSEIKKSAFLIKDKMTMMIEVQRLLRYARTSGALCDAHKKFCDLPNDCETQVKCEGAIEVKI